MTTLGARSRRTSGRLDAGAPLRICVCTSYAAHREPRAPRHAAALSSLGRCQIHFVDAAPRGTSRVAVAALDNIPRLEWTTLGVPHRSDGLWAVAANRLAGRVARATYALVGVPCNAALNSGIPRMGGVLKNSPADIYFAHNIDTLLPAWHAARRHGAQLLFDSMEYHADMGSGQSPVERRLIDEIQRKCLPDCLLITASSPEVAESLERDYGLDGVLPLYNVPSRVDDLQPKRPGFNLYWRNSVVNVGERGLSDVLAAMPHLPEDIHLHLQGGLPADGGRQLRQDIERLGLSPRVTFHPPYRPELAVWEASPFQVGLCLERPTCRNHDLTVSNKMFDYHMAGLAIVSSDLPGLRRVITRSGGGVCFRAGDVHDLRSVLLDLYNNPQQLREHAAKARSFAQSEANLERVMSDLTSGLQQRLEARHPELMRRLSA